MRLTSLQFSSYKFAETYDPILLYFFHYKFGGPVRYVLYIQMEYCTAFHSH